MKTIFAPMVALVMMLLFWWGVQVLLDLPPYLLPDPWTVFGVLLERWQDIGKATMLTGAASLGGLALSLFVGCLAGLTFARFQWLEKGLFPYAVFFQTVPVVAVAPLVILWVGHGFLGVITVAFIISIFPIVSGATLGLTRIPHQQIELFRLYGASRVQTLLKLQIPNAMEQVLAGARVSSGLCVIGAIVGEFSAGFGTGNHGLGYLILFSSGQLKTPLLLASILASTFLGFLLFSLVHHVGGWWLKSLRYVQGEEIPTQRSSQ